MFEKIRVMFTIPELRQKILLTLVFLAIYRVGWQITLPIADPVKMREFAQSKGGIADIFNTVAMFSATNLKSITIFGLGIMPYISASIIFQLLGSVWGPLERLQKEGESGRKKINEYTRYATVVICLFQSWVYVRGILVDRGLIAQWALNDSGNPQFSWILVTIATMTCGTVFLMWLGEQIDEFGIGNGISLLIMANILSGMPAAVSNLIANQATTKIGGDNGRKGPEVLLMLLLLFIGVVVGVVYMTEGQRRIPTQSAKHVRGRKQFGGGRQYLPLKVNQGGVMPIIFASSLLMFPQMIFGFLAGTPTKEPSIWNRIWSDLQSSFTRGQSFVYSLCYILLIYFFCYFWTAITFNPKDMADNLKNFGTFIPGYRPGRRTADHLERVMVRITYVGAGFLAVVAILPTLVSSFIGIDPNVANFFGGTGLLIVVSVAFDLVQKIDSHLVMRNYRGLLE